MNKEERVITLNSETFDTVLSFTEMVMVAFVADTCRICTLVHKEYEKAAKQLRKEKIQVTLARIDVGNSTDVAERLGIKRVPSYKLYGNNGKRSVDYRGIRTADAIVKWIRLFEVNYVSNKEELAEFRKKHKDVLLASIPGDDESTAKVLTKLPFHDLGVAIAAYAGSKSDLMNMIGLDAPIVLYRDSNGMPASYNGDFADAALLKFIKSHTSSSLMTFSRDRAGEIFGVDRKEHVLIFYDFADKNAKALKSTIRSIATDHEELDMAYVLVSADEYFLLEKFRIRRNELPAILLIDAKKATKSYHFQRQGQDLNSAIDSNLVDELIKFVQTFRSGKLTPSLKSSEPVDDSDEKLKQIVGSQFQERVMKSDKDILLIFIAPWCSYCKALSSIYTHLAEKYSGVDSIMIAKMDAIKNDVDHPEVNVVAYPTIMFFPAGDKNHPVKYEGHRDVKSFVKFLQSHTQYFAQKLHHEL
ncbi:unnamed protein product [Albugo candida]|uniref:Thioredoxin domain-containing protein n=1 Tax=Albugo candida TaxID=65357 RepID=A0A024G8G3_9STRA|nr:unnamed protein product [Albugo candida]|eukprot:CCI42835.1 unnamed protein product [Albugo candida]